MKEENEKKHIGHCMSKRIYLQSRCTSNARRQHVHLLSDIQSKRNSPVFPCTVRSFFERATAYGTKRRASFSPSSQGGSEASSTVGRSASSDGPPPPACVPQSVGWSRALLRSSGLVGVAVPCRISSAVPRQPSDKHQEDMPDDSITCWSQFSLWTVFYFLCICLTRLTRKCFLNNFNNKFFS